MSSIAARLRPPQSSLVRSLLLLVAGAIALVLLSDAIGDTNKAATSVLSASSDLTSTAELLSREVDNFFRNLRADGNGDGAARTGTAN